MSSLPWKIIFEILALPPDTAAYLDWTTGILRINANYEQWFDLISRTDGGILVPTTLSSQELDLLETVTHESTHLLQIVTTGFLYSVAVELYAGIGTYVESFGSSFGEDDVLAILEHGIPAALMEEIRSILLRLDVCGPDNVTARSIVESSAFMAQKRTHHLGLSRQKYAQMLETQCPGPEYRRAYDVAVQYLGDDAFDLFPLLASLSLCTRRPEQIFSSFCEQISKENGPSGAYISVPGQSEVSIDLGGFLRVLNAISAELIGSAAQAAANLPEHPFYTDIVNQINLLNRDGAISLDRYITAPHEIQERLFEECLRPMIFNRSGEHIRPIVIPGGLWPTLSKEAQAEKVRGLIVIAAIYSKTLAKVS
jgi:hypothetical protein